MSENCKKIGIREKFFVIFDDITYKLCNFATIYGHFALMTMADKLYYNIKEVSEMIGVEPSTLRYWETAFPTLQPKTTGNKVRQYKKEDIELIRLIHNLVKVRGLKLEAARKEISASRGVVEKKTKTVELLTRVRDELQAIKEKLDEL